MRVADSKSASWRAVCDILTFKHSSNLNYSRLIVLGYGEVFLDYVKVFKPNNFWRLLEKRPALKLNGDGIVAKSGPNSRDPMNCRPSGSSVPGIIQAGILEWVAICFSRISSRPRN